MLLSLLILKMTLMLLVENDAKKVEKLPKPRHMVLI